MLIGSLTIWAEQKHYLNMLVIVIDIDFKSRMILTLTQRILENKYWTLRFQMTDAQGNVILLITIQKGAHQPCLCSNTWNAYVHLMSTTPTNQFGSDLIVIMLWTTFVSGNEVKEYNPEAIHVTLLRRASISANCFRIHISCCSTPVTRLSTYGFDSRQLQISPKKTTGTTRLIFFWKGCRQFTQHWVE